MNSRLAKIAATTAVAAVVLLCLFGHLGAVGLVGPDEPRYAWIARAMARTGDWVTPRLYGRPWLEKPVLYYWAAGFFFRFMHQPEWAARLPSALAALLALLAMVRAALRHFGEETAYATAFIWPTTVAAIGFARAAAPDMLFSAALAAALASATRTVIVRTDAESPAPLPEDPSRLSLISWGAWLGMAVLAKGPAGIALAGGSVGLWVLATRNWRAAFRLLHPLAVLSFCIVALPWYTSCAIRNPDFLRVFLWQHNFKRYTTNVFQHHQPVWFFAEILLLGFLPWTALLWPVAARCVRTWKEKNEQNSVSLFLTCWVVFPILFFSFSQSKLPGYILPVFAPLSLLAAASIGEAPLGKDRPARLSIAILGASLGPVAGLELLFSSFLHRGRAVPAAPAGLLIIGLVVFPAVVFWHFQRKRISAVILAAILTACLVEFANRDVLPELDARISARQVSKFAQNLPQAASPLYSYRVDRSWQYGVSFYQEREIAEWPAAEPEPALLLTGPESLEELRRRVAVKILWNDLSPQCTLVEIRSLPGSAGRSGYRAASGSD